MRIFPVLDLKGGQAVHALGGDRDHYRPVRSVLHASTIASFEGRSGLLSSWESLHIVLRMIRNWVSGRYSMPIATVLGGIAAVLYFVDPLDLIPDSIPVLGYLDDAVVIAAFIRLNRGEISRFRNWEVSRSFYPRP